MQERPDLVDPNLMKERYSVDAYYVPLDQIPSEDIVNSSMYWYSLWSHTRDGQWKGYLRIDLANYDDQQARSQLD